MHNFKDFNIKPKINAFVGEKIQVQKLFNLPVKVLDFKIEPSKQKAGTELLTLQIEKSGEKRIVFTGSTVMIDQIKRVPEDKFPFTTTIKGDNDYYEFT
jgi:hypothetical protein